MSTFSLHPQLAADTTAVAHGPLSQLLLFNDAHYAWFVLVPRRSGLRELYELQPDDQLLLLAESMELGRALMQAYAGEKLNVAALGNMVPQLHLHHIVRHAGDPAWPGPVWGRHPAVPYTAELRAERLRPLPLLLGGTWRWP